MYENIYTDLAIFILSSGFCIHFMHTDLHGGKSECKFS